MTSYSPRILSSFLKQKFVKAGILDKLKIIYRPYICPFDLLLKHIDKKNKIFDIGCGSGQFLLLAAHFTQPSGLTGIEISETLVQNAKLLLKDYSGTKLNVYNGQELPDDICEHDLVFMIDVLHHIPKKMQDIFIQQLFSKMGSSTKLIIKDIDKGSPLVYCNKIHDLLLAGEIGNELKMQNLEKILKQTGFKIVSVEKKLTLWYPHYCIVAEKP